MKSSALKTDHPYCGHWPDADKPSVKKPEAVYILPRVEVITYKTEKDLKESYKQNCGIFIKEHLWGWLESIPELQTYRIHLRSVKSHGGVNFFYHTLGHEVAHAMEALEREKPTSSYIGARWKELFLVMKWTIYDISERIGERVTGLYGRATKVFKKRK